MKKRALWLLNHTTLREFEVPLLVELGYEVFCPKIYQYQFGDLSASVSYEYDASLTIPAEALEKLNQTDFYGLRVSDEIAQILNQYFEIAFFGAFSEQIYMLTRQFQGVMVFRAFGLDKSSRYTDVFRAAIGEYFLSELQQLEGRFWFGASYENLAEIEYPFFRRQNVYLPIGMKKTEIHHDWVGEDPRILFVCPRINSNSYYKNIYDEFQESFGDLPYAIGGAQMVPVADNPNVLGFVSGEQYRYNMTHMAAMFYHSQEPRHIHFHPFEAIRNGMPLVFMGGGLLDSFGGATLPGRCRTTAEAHGKLKRLSNGDQALAKQIIDTQGILIEPFREEFCRKLWRQGFAKIEAAYAPKGPMRQTPKKIGILIPQGYLGGVLDYSIRLAQCIRQGARDAGDEISVVLGHIDSDIYQEQACFDKAIELGIPVRPFRWEHKSAQWASRAYQLEELPQPWVNEMYVPEDGCGAFQDCAYLIFTADRLPGPVFLRQPYAVVAHDYIQRYEPGLFGALYEQAVLDASRNADAVLVTTPATYQDALQYAGIKEERLFLTPPLFDLVEKPTAHKPGRRTGTGAGAPTQAEPYFLWATNLAVHKNHKRALLALSDYYQRGGALLCMITGVDSDLLSPDVKLPEEGDPRITQRLLDCRKLVKQDRLLQENLVFHGSLPMQRYLGLLSGAAFVFHPGYGDNGTGTAVDGACLGVPAVCGDYPAMRDLDRMLQLHAQFFDPFQAKAICRALEDAEFHREESCAALPSREQLRRHTVDGVYGEVYQVIRTIVGGLR